MHHRNFSQNRHGQKLPKGSLLKSGNRVATLKEILLVPSPPLFAGAVHLKTFGDNVHSVQAKPTRESISRAACRHSAFDLDVLTSSGSSSARPIFCLEFSEPYRS